MPQPKEEMVCPMCGGTMKKNKHGVFVCQNKDCRAAILPKPDSIFGVH